MSLFLILCLSSLVDESHDGALLPVPESVLYQTKVPLANERDYINRQKAQAKKNANDRMKHLARSGSATNNDFSPPSLDKHEHEFVSEVEFTKRHTRQKKWLSGGRGSFWLQTNRPLLCFKSSLTCCIPLPEALFVLHMEKKNQTNRQRRPAGLISQHCVKIVKRQIISAGISHITDVILNF